MTHYTENYSYPYKQRGSVNIAKTTDKLTGLSRLSHYLAGSDTIENLIDMSTGYIRNLLKVDICKIFVLLEDGSFQQMDVQQEPSEALNQVFSVLAASYVTQRPSSIEQVLNSQCREALGLRLRDSHWIVPLDVGRFVVGMLVLGKKNSVEMEAFPRDSYYLVDLIADQLGNALYRKQLNDQLENSSIETVLALSKTLDTRDPHSGEHSRRLAFYSEQLAQQFNLSSRETRELCWAALLHDIGKIGIEDQILHKPGPLTVREWEIMKSHSEVGAQIVKGLSGLENIASIILSHHERVDGTGYPRRLQGDQIPLGARIIAVVDSFSAMTEGRVYQPSRTQEEAINELKQNSGKMYDPMVVNAFIQLIEGQQTLD